MCLAQGHDTVRLVRLKLATSRFYVKHSTTEPLHSVQKNSVIIQWDILCKLLVCKRLQLFLKELLNGNFSCMLLHGHAKRDVLKKKCQNNSWKHSKTKTH